MEIRAQLVRQFGRPHGVVGRVAGWVMGHRSSNVVRNRWVVSLLALRPTDRVLEIGFGPGVAIGELARHARHVYGVDHSALMVRSARRRNARAIDEGIVELFEASVERLPEVGRVDVVVAVNSFGFWPDPAARLVELRRVLRPGGRIALASQPRTAGASAETTGRQAGWLAELLVGAGFSEVRTETLELDPPVACVLARS